jgi:metal-responsive CopG/Arc/MetJ family transcriptional regulator
MKTVQMTLDESLIKKVDIVARRLHTNRSAFTRNALREALGRAGAAELEAKHRKGYLRHPASADEFSVWESVQAWGDE